jgi:flagellar basal body P-ring formation protein FlgA
MRVEGAAVVFAAGLWLSAGLAATAQDLQTPDLAPPTPRIVIYPGDIIQNDMLSDLPANTARGVGPFAETRSAVIGKMARRTLLPGGAIPLAAVDIPRLVVNGAEVSLVFVEGGLLISTVGMALQDGATGDFVKVRNDDSGVTVTGVVQPDGAVRVSGG